MGNPAYRGPYAYASQDNAQVGTLAGGVAFADGVSPGLILPDWDLLTVGAVVGDLMLVNGDGVEFDPEYDEAILQMSGFVLHNYGKYVVFGYGWDNDDPQEFARVQCNSTSFVHASARRNVSIRSGAVLKLYISSTFLYESFEWQNVELIGFGA